MKKNKKIFYLFAFIMILITLKGASSTIDYEQAVHYYKFEDATESVEGTGTLTGTNAGYITGKVDNAMDLESGSSHFVVNTTLNGTGMALVRTINFWLKPESLATDDKIFELHPTSSTSPTVFFDLKDTDDMRFILVWAGDNHVIQCVNALNIGTWTMLTTIINSSGAYIYVNDSATPCVSDSVANAYMDSDYNEIVIGKIHNVADYYDGIIDNLVLTKQEWGDAERIEAYNSGAGKDYSVAPNNVPATLLELPLTNNITIDLTPEFMFNVSDADVGDTESCTLWLGSTPYGTNTSVTKDTTTTIVANASLTAGTNYDWYVNCSDGTDTNMSETRTIKIASTPTTSSVSITDPAYTNSTFTCTASGTFIESWNYTWYNNSVILSGEKNKTMTIAGFDATDVINCTAYGTNHTLSYDTANKSDTVTISNSIPSTFLSNPENNNITIDTTPTFYYNVTDDNSEQTLNCNLYVNDIPYGQNTSVFNGTITGETVNASISVGTYDWYVNCTDGTDSSATSTRSIQIASTPTISTVSVTDPSYTNTTITCSASGTFIESWNYTWYNNSVILTGEVNSTISIAGFDATDVINCTAYGTNHTLSYDTANKSDTVTISNSIPRITLAFPTQNDTTNNNNTLQFNFTIYDDNEEQTLTSILYINNITYGENTSVLNSNNTAIQINASLTDGDYEWYITYSDGVATYNSSIRNLTIDTTSPDITITNPSTSNNTVAMGNITLNIVINDTNIYLANATIYENNCSAGATFKWTSFIDDLTGVGYAFTNLTPSWTDNFYCIKVTGADWHTDGKMDKAKKGKRGENILLFGEDDVINTTINITFLKVNDLPASQPADLKSTITEVYNSKGLTAYKWSISYTSENYQYKPKFIITSPLKIKYAEPFTGISGHLLWGSNTYYHDFVSAETIKVNGVDVPAEIQTTVIDDYTVEVVIIPSIDIKNNDFIEIDPESGALNIVRETVLYEIDNTKPAIAFQGQTPTNTTRRTGNSMTVNASITETPSVCLLQIGVDNSFTNYTMTKSAKNCSYTFATTDGKYYNFSVYANDSVNNMNNTATRNFIENTKPTKPTISSPSAYQNFSTSPITSTYNSTDAEFDSATYYIQINDTSNTTDTDNDGTENIAFNEDRTYNITVIAWDGYENSTISDVTYFSLDTTSPAISFNEPTTNESLNVNFTYINVTVSDSFSDIDTCLLEWNDTTNYTMTKSGTICIYNRTGLSEGIHEFRVFANDTLGNMNNSKNKTVTIDLTVPSITDLDPVNNTLSSLNTNHTITISVSDVIAGIDTCIINWSGTTEAMTYNSTDGNCTISRSLTNNTNHTYYFIVNDTVNNILTSEAYYISKVYNYTINTTFNNTVRSYDLNVTFTSENIGRIRRYTLTSKLVADNTLDYANVVYKVNKSILLKFDSRDTSVGYETFDSFILNKTSDSNFVYVNIPEALNMSSGTHEMKIIYYITLSTSSRTTGGGNSPDYEGTPVLEDTNVSESIPNASIIMDMPDEWERGKSVIVYIEFKINNSRKDPDLLTLSVINGDTQLIHYTDEPRKKSEGYYFASIKIPEDTTLGTYYVGAKALYNNEVYEDNDAIKIVIKESTVWDRIKNFFQNLFDYLFNQRFG